MNKFHFKIISSKEQIKQKTLLKAPTKDTKTVLVANFELDFEVDFTDFFNLKIVCARHVTKI